MRTTTNEKLKKVISEIENTKAEIEKSKEVVKDKKKDRSRIR